MQTASAQEREIELNIFEFAQQIEAALPASQVRVTETANGHKITVDRQDVIFAVADADYQQGMIDAAIREIKGMMVARCEGAKSYTSAFAARWQPTMTMTGQAA